MQTSEIVRRWQVDNPKKKGTYDHVGKSVGTALDVLGDQCDIKHVLILANWLLIPGYETCKGTVYIERLKWRKSKAIKRDCRTYKGQQRRDMVRDNYPLELAPTDVLFFIKHGTALSRIIGKAHSIDQLREWASLKLKSA